MTTRSPVAVVTAECFGQESDRTDTGRCFRAFCSPLLRLVLMRSVPASAVAPRRHSEGAS